MTISHIYSEQVDLNNIEVFDTKDQEEVEKERNLIWLKDHAMLDFTILGYELLSLRKGDLQKIAVR